jgi:ESCRT-I complex subunit TSG101
MIRRMEDEMVELNDCNRQLNVMNSQLSELLSKCDETEKTVDIDDAYGPSQPLYKQLLNAFSEENAVVDAIYYLGEALRKEVIDLEVFLKVSVKIISLIVLISA